MTMHAVPFVRGGPWRWPGRSCARWASDRIRLTPPSDLDLRARIVRVERPLDLHGSTNPERRGVIRYRHPRTKSGASGALSVGEVLEPAVGLEPRDLLIAIPAAPDPNLDGVTAYQNPLQQENGLSVGDNSKHLCRNQPGTRGLSTASLPDTSRVLNGRRWPT